MTFDTKPQRIEFKNITIPMKAVLRRLGYPPEENALNGRVKSIFENELERASSLFEPKSIYRILPVDTNSDGIVSFKKSGFQIHSRQVSKMLKPADPVLLFMATLGPRLEEEVNRLFSEDHMAEAVILDAIGSETADAVADKMHREILKHLAEDKGLGVTPRFSPGYGDWPVTVQGEFCEVCGGGKIGITVNESSLMSPRKSVSAVLGWVKKS
ncbi:MAG: vitamin B12 dependent-methionine synthase activation domain-containing protein [bacterium]